MASHRVVLPLTWPTCLSKAKFADDYLPSLSQHLSVGEWAASIGRINAANQSNTMPRVFLIIAFIGTFIGLNTMISSDDGTVNGFYLTLFSLIMMCFAGARVRTTHIANVTNAVLAEHNSYSNRVPQVCWRINNPATKFATLEIDLLHPLISNANIANNNTNHLIDPNQYTSAQSQSHTVEMHYHPQHSQSAPAQSAAASPAPVHSNIPVPSAYPVVNPPSYSLPVAQPVQQSNADAFYVSNGQLIRQPLVLNAYGQY